MLRAMLAALVLVGLAIAGGGTAALAQAPRTKMIIATGVDPSLGTFYVAKVGGFFERNGLDVQVNTGPSGSAMVPFLVQNQVQAVLAAEQAGIVNFALDHNVVVASQAMMMLRYFAVVGRNVQSLDGLKGRKIGVPVGSAGDVFWRALVTKLNLDPKDYTIIPVEPPEMVAAMERGNIDAISAWEPWVTRTIQAVPNTKILRDNEGIISTRNFLYINRGWAEQNPDAAVRFMRALVEATDYIHTDPDDAAKQIASFLKMDPTFTRELIGKVDFDMRLDQGSVDYLKTVEAQLRDAGRLPRPVDWDRFIYPDVARSVIPDKVKLNGAG